MFVAHESQSVLCSTFVSYDGPQLTCLHCHDGYVKLGSPISMKLIMILQMLSKYNARNIDFFKILGDLESMYYTTSLIKLKRISQYRFSKPSIFVSFCARLWLSLLLRLSLSSSLQAKNKCLDSTYLWPWFFFSHSRKISTLCPPVFR